MSSLNATNTLAISVFFVALDVGAVALRFCSRLSRRTAVAVDDWICIPALLVTTGCAALLIYGISQKVVGYHTGIPTSIQEAMAEETIAVLSAKIFVSFSMISTLAIGLIKLAFLLCYRRIFSGKVFSYLNWMLVGISIAWTLTFIIAPISACGSNIDLLWQPQAPQGACINTQNLPTITSILDFVIDLGIMVLPLPWVWKLNMTLGKKLAVSAVFLTGAIATACAAMRMAVMIQLTSYNPLHGGTIFGMEPTDMTGILSFFYLFTWIEIGVGMLVCCLPSLRLLFDQFPLRSKLSSYFSGMRSAGSSESRGSFSKSRSPRFMSWSSKSSFARSLGMSPKSPSAASFESVSYRSEEMSPRPYDIGMRKASHLREMEMAAGHV